MRTKIILLTGILLLSIAISACSGIALAQTDSPTVSTEGSNQVNRTISVSGHGEVTLTPDIAYITIGVHTEGKDASEAVATNNAQTQKVIEALKKAGVDEKDIRTTNFSIYPQQEYDQQGKPTGNITYIVDNQVFVTVRDLQAIGDLLNAAVSAGANNIYGITFDVSDKSKALSEARQKAVEDGQVQAEELAEAAGVGLGPVITISTFGATPVPIYEGKGGGVALEAAATVPVSPGQMKITTDVTLVYQIK